MNINRYIDFDGLTLSKGSHDSPADGMCAMEAAAWIAGEEHSDNPQCVCPVIGAYIRSLNDNMNREDRQKLKPLIVACLGTNDESLLMQRTFMVVDRAVRVFAPIALAKARMESEAEKVRNLAPVVDKETAANAATRAYTANAYTYNATYNSAYTHKAANAAYKAVNAANAATRADTRAAANAASCAAYFADAYAEGIELAWDLIRLSWPDARPIEDCPSEGTPLELVCA